MSKTYNKIARYRNGRSICQPRYVSKLIDGYKEIEEKFPNLPLQYVPKRIRLRNKAYDNLDCHKQYWRTVWEFRKQSVSLLRDTENHWTYIRNYYGSKKWGIDRFITPNFTIELHLNTRTLQVTGYYVKVVGEKHKYFATLLEAVEYVYSENLTAKWCIINTEPISYTVTGLGFSVSITCDTLKEFIKQIGKVFNVKDWLGCVQQLEYNLCTRKPYIETYYRLQDFERCPMKKLTLEINAT